MVRMVLSFDDGRHDNYVMAKKILEPLSIPATFNITMGYVEKKLNDNDIPGPHKPMTKSEITRLDSKLFEIAGHGYRHNSDLDNLVKGVLDLRSVVSLKSKVTGVASPNSDFDLAKIHDAKKKFEKNNILYLRVSNRYAEMSMFMRVVRRINRVLHIPYLFYLCNRTSLLKKSDTFILYSIPVLRDNHINEIKYFISKIITQYPDAKFILLFHSVLHPDEMYYNDLFSWDYDEFYKLCLFLCEKRDDGVLQIVTTDNLLNEGD